MAHEVCFEHWFAGPQDPQAHPFSVHARLHYKCSFADGYAGQGEDLFVVRLEEDGEHFAVYSVLSAKIHEIKSLKENCV